MPTYEYVCKKCGTHVEVYQRIGEESLTVCGVCGGELRKVFHPAGILLKGSGFYKTDNRPKSPASSGSSSESSGSGSSSGESKPKKDSPSKPAGSKEKSA